MAFLNAGLTTNRRESIKGGRERECCGGFRGDCSVNKLRVKKQESM